MQREEIQEFESQLAKSRSEIQIDAIKISEAEHRAETAEAKVINSLKEVF